MHQSMWSNRNGAKYELPSYFCTSQFKTADEWTLMILSTNKDYPNVLNIKAQTKGLSIEQLKSNLAIMWSTEEPANETTEEDLRRQLTEERLEQTRRQKGYKIQDKTKLMILRMHFNEGSSISQISNALFIPYSSVSRIISEFNTNPKMSSNWFESTTVRVSESKIIKKAIVSYVNKSSNVFNSADIARYIEQTFNVTLQKRSIIKFLKNDMNMSYRKASSRPWKSNSCTNQIFKVLFCIDFANNIDPFDVLVNIDEVLFLRSTKTNYTWMEKGNQNICYNSSFTGSLSLIGAITSLGDWFFSSLNSRNNSEIFISFMNDLMKWLTIDLKIDSRRIILIMDNSPIHTSNYWMKALCQQNWKVMLLSPYWPQFAAIEMMFHILKWRLWMLSRQEIICFSKPNGIRAIREALASFSAQDITCYWIKAIANMNWELVKLMSRLAKIK